MCRSNFNRQKGPFAIDIVSLAVLAPHDGARQNTPLPHSTIQRLWNRLVGLVSSSWNWLYRLCSGSDQRGIRLE